MSKEKYQTIITPGRSASNYWKDIYRYRELFYIFSWRDIKVRYKQTAIGILWAILRPLLTMIILTVVFGVFAKLPAEGEVPYPIMVLAGLLPWQFFANATSESGSSLLDNQNLITKVYFPRLIIPLSATVTSFVDFLIALVLLIPLMLMYQFTPSWQFLFLPLFALLLFLLSFGFGTILTALNVKYRDFRYVLPFVVQIGLYLSPVGYSTSIVPEKYQVIYSLNPMVGIIEGFRWCLLGESSISLLQTLISISITLIILFIGIRYFRKTEKYFADLI